MKNHIIYLLLSLFIVSCSNDEIDLTVYNSEISAIENLNNGVPVLDIIAEIGISPLYGLEYGGGFIFHVNETDGSLLVATDYSEIGDVAWGDVFDLDTSPEIGSGPENTEQIIIGNLNDNSVNGTEFGSDNYAFKIVSDLEYRDFNDWFIPSSGSMKAIYDNVHSLGFGNFDETLIYWSSTKEGYFPYVMAFNFNSWGGEAFPGSCLVVNGVLIARKI
ncbi:MAG: Uncharacterised protein [Flavobacterium sp. SCGC AAA160-P02]|nr:MAG: Uncharacterised protein [Flavobacterium sp. SCGC AAA160-P02]